MGEDIFDLGFDIDDEEVEKIEKTVLENPESVDSDKDGVRNLLDCNAFDPAKQEQKSPFESVGEGKAWSLSTMLNIPVEEDIPITLLRKIKNTPLGETITNPTEKGKQTVKVTKKLKQKAVFAYNVKTKW